MALQLTLFIELWMRSLFEIIIHEWPFGWCVHDGCHKILNEVEQQNSAQKGSSESKHRPVHAERHARIFRWKVTQSNVDGSYILLSHSLNVCSLIMSTCCLLIIWVNFSSIPGEENNICAVSPCQLLSGWQRLHWWARAGRPATRPLPEKQQGEMGASVKVWDICIPVQTCLIFCSLHMFTP